MSIFGRSAPRARRKHLTLAVILIAGLVAFLVPSLAGAASATAGTCVPSPGQDAYDETVPTTYKTVHHDAVAETFTIVHHAATPDAPLQRYSWNPKGPQDETNGPGSTPLTDPDNWQANTSNYNGDDPLGSVFQRGGGNGGNNASWFYWTFTPGKAAFDEPVSNGDGKDPYDETVPDVLEHVVHHDAIAPVVCDNPPVKHKEIGLYLYKKKDASAPPSWENSGPQIFIASKAGDQYYTTFPGTLPPNVCGDGWAVQQDGVEYTSYPPFSWPATITYPVDNIGWPPIYKAKHQDLESLVTVPPCNTDEVIVTPTVQKVNLCGVLSSITLPEGLFTFGEVVYNDAHTHFSVEVTANNGKTFANGQKTITLSGELPAKIDNQSTNPEGPCYVQQESTPIIPDNPVLTCTGYTPPVDTDLQSYGTDVVTGGLISQANDGKYYDDSAANWPDEWVLDFDNDYQASYIGPESLPESECVTHVTVTFPPANPPTCTQGGSLPATPADTADYGFVWSGLTLNAVPKGNVVIDGASSKTYDQPQGPIGNQSANPQAPCYVPPSPTSEVIDVAYPVLSSTGSNDAPLLAAAIAFVVVGAGAVTGVAIARRRRSASA